MIILHESQTFSPASLYRQYMLVDEIQLEACENYQKRSLRNKYYIQTSQGPLALTIPLKSGKNAQMPIKNVVISYEENWQKQHLQAIRTAYGKSPFFEYYFDKIENLFLKKNNFLFDFNLESLFLMLKLLKIELNVTESNFYALQASEEMNMMRNYNWKSPYISQTKELPYVQVWSPPQTFYQGLSILDVLFCGGPQTKEILVKPSFSEVL